MNEGKFINYQMAEAINLVNNPPIDRTLEKALEDLKRKWQEDLIPGYNVAIGTSIPGMQDITIEEVYELREQAIQADTYTVQNSAAMQYCITFDENGKFKSFDFTKLEEIIKLAHKYNKKVIIDSAVVFGDLKNNNLSKLSKEEIQEVISTYIKTLTTKYGQYIERIDVFNAVFQRSEIDQDNPSEKFWIETFGTNYPEEIVTLVRENMNPQYKDKIKLCWNEFYLTNSNSKYSGRREMFLEMIKRLDIDCIGIQDRFTTGTPPEYITKALQEISKVCRECGKKICITELSCTASGYDRKNTSTEEINRKVKRNLQAVEQEANTNPTIISVEGAVSDKHDYNHHELLNHKECPRDISTTGNQGNPSINQEHNNELSSMFTEQNAHKQENYQIQMVNHQEKQKVKTLGNNQNKGYTNHIILLITSILCIGIIMIIYWIIK